MKNKWLLLALSLVLPMLLLTGCRTSKMTTSSKIDTGKERLTLREKLRHQLPTAAYRSAKVKVRLDLNGRDLSCNGSLKMQKDQMIRLSLTFFGFEVGRMEFTPSTALLVDRTKKQFVRAAYRDIPALRDAGLDFYTLQALFWNQLWLPGEAHNNPENLLKNKTLRPFQLTADPSRTSLTYNDRDRLRYTFFVGNEKGVLEGGEITDLKKHSTPIRWHYDKFEHQQQQWLPQVIGLNIYHPKRQLQLSLELSALNDKKMNLAPTSLSRNYTERSVSELLDRLLR